MKKRILQIVCALAVFASVFAFTPLVSAEEVVYYNDAKTLMPQPYGASSVDYETKAEVSDNLPFLTPDYHNNTSISNACAPVAGAVLFGYYDKTYTNLIPNFEPYAKMGPVTRPKGMSDDQTASVVSSLITQLASDMGTNSIRPGTNETQFLNGLNKYASRQGYTLSKSSMMDGDSFYFPYVMTAIQQGKPVAILATSYSLGAVGDTGSNFTVSSSTYSQAHIMIISGFTATTLYVNQISVATFITFRVSTGYSNYSGKRLIMDENLKVENAYALSIS